MINTSRISAIVFSALGCAQPAWAVRPDALIAQAERQAVAFAERFSAVVCDEQVERRKLEPDGKVILARRELFDYVILLQTAGDELFVEESRVVRGKPAREPERPLLLTNGFSTFLLVFHPMFVPSFTFEDAGEEQVNGRRYRRISFTHLPGRRSPSVIQLHHRDYPVPWRGVAWVDPASGEVARIQAELPAPWEDIGLAKLRAEVWYASVRLPGADGPLLLPQAAEIEAASRRQRWWNRHSFQRYRQFQVSTDQKIQDPVEAPK